MMRRIQYSSIPLRISAFACSRLFSFMIVLVTLVLYTQYYVTQGSVNLLASYEERAII